MLLFQILFWLSVLLIFHSYILYPVILFMFSKKKNNEIFFSRKEELLKVSILISIYNEEKVIAKKIDSILNSNYPAAKIQILIGSDKSSDKSNEIVSKYAQENKSINFFSFNERQGKPSIINKIYKYADGEIIILTDANVFFDKNTIYEVVKYFKNPKIGLVDTHMKNKGIIKDGISIQESQYISREVRIKNAESNIWGTMMGPFGGCYAIRNDLYEPVPSNFLVDDFYINMEILQKGYKAINNLNAFVFEDVSNNLYDEFRRKIRIATGNFQNLKKFRIFLLGIIGLNPLKNIKNIHINTFGLSFSFISHKVLRWVTPFFIILLLLSNIFLLETTIYQLSFAGLLFSFSIPLWDTLLKKVKINISILRFITHFYSMNLALIIGFFKYLKGVKSGVWQPTKRNQTEN